MVIVEESNVRDKPIYLHVGDRTYVSNSFWFVIEEKVVDLVGRTAIEEEEEEEKEIHDKKMERILRGIYVDDEINKINKNKFLVLKQSKTEKIRELPLPRPRVNPIESKLIIFNNRIYLLGGYLRDTRKRETGDYGNPFLGARTEVIYYDNRHHPGKDWLEGPSLMLPRRYMFSAVAIPKSGYHFPGLFFAFGQMEENIREIGPPSAEYVHLNDSSHGMWMLAPPLPCSDFSAIQLLGFSDTMVYLYAKDSLNCLGLSFDVKNYKWSVFDRTFGYSIWHRGLVIEFCNDSYLLLYGLRRLEVPLDNHRLYVYDLNKLEWLPQSVDGLVEDGTVLPTPNSERTDSFLFQMNQKNKFAFVWTVPFCTSSDYMTEIHCTKFILHHTIDSDSDYPIFRAQVLSYGCYHVKGGSLYDCTVPVIGGDNEEFGFMEE